jgi:hypothetical protein
MPRSKSTTGSKTGRATKEPTNGVTSAEAQVVTEASATKSEPRSEAKIPEPRIASESRKFEVVKNESRKNIVPINMEDEIRRRAYELYEQRGSIGGSESEDWLAAEREVMQRYHQHTA